MTDNYIAVDWGSTHLRAWRVLEGACVDSLTLASGVSRLKEERARDVFERHITPWRGDEKLPVIMAGMIGSEAGWMAVPYLACPVRLEAIGPQCYPIDDNVWIVPGLKTASDNHYNVMRGEETQLLGAAKLAPATCYVLPGTHCKWVWADGETLSNFTTVMTGEMHHLLMTNSLIGRALPEQKEDPQAFHRGLERGLASPSLLPELFETRARWVLGELERTSVSDYLSGLLIGAEVATQLTQMRPLSITIVGGEQLLARYQAAFSLSGISVTVCAGDAAFLQGIERIVHERY